LTVRTLASKRLAGGRGSSDAVPAVQAQAASELSGQRLTSVVVLLSSFVASACGASLRAASHRATLANARNAPA
jgi:hypothetical protein